MSINTIVVNSDHQVKKQICFVISNLNNYKVIDVYDYLNEVKHLNKDSLLIVSLNTEAYATDYLSLHEIINKHPGIIVVILASSASKNIISKAFTMQCAAIVDKQHFQLFAELILENITMFRGFYVSPLFVKYLIEESPISTDSSTVLLSK
jgi:DNA-binding NarL/FixJ family response regulator